MTAWYVIASHGRQDEWAPEGLPVAVYMNLEQAARHVREFATDAVPLEIVEVVPIDGRLHKEYET